MSDRRTAFGKHRLAKDIFEVDFAKPTNAPRLRTGETLTTGTASVSVAKGTDATGWTDVTAEFLAGGEQVQGSKVAFTLIAAASATDQDAGDDYRMKVEVDTDQSRHLVSTHQLVVSERADPDAP